MGAVFALGILAFLAFLVFFLFLYVPSHYNSTRQSALHGLVALGDCKRWSPVAEPEPTFLTSRKAVLRRLNGTKF